MGKSAPKAPDPAATAKAQGAANVETAQEQARLAMTGQTTPWGTLDWQEDPTSPSGQRAITTLSPDQQNLLDLANSLQGQYGQVAGEQLGRVADTFSQPFDLNAARGSEIADLQRTFMDPQWDQRGEALQTDLLNRGIRPGSEAYDQETRRFDESRNHAYDQMFLDAWGQANNAALTERNLPMQDLASLGIGAFPQQPGGIQLTQTPSPGVAPTDVMGPTYANYNAQNQAYQSGMGGLYGLGGSLLGGWASSGFPWFGPALMF